MKKTLAVLFASAALLAACGGDDGNVSTPAPAPTPAPTPAPNTPPAAISDTVTNFIGYLLVLVGQTSDAEALDVSAVTPPLSDTAEPTTLP